MHAQTRMKATDSFRLGDIDVRFEYEFELNGYGQPSTSQNPKRGGSWQKIWLTGTQEAGFHPHLTLQVVYGGRPYEYSAEVDPGEIYSNFIPYTQFNIDVSLTLTALIRVHGPCSSTDERVVLIPQTKGGETEVFYIIPNESAPVGSIIGATVVVLVEYGGSIARESYRRQVEASPPYDIRVTVTGYEPTLFEQPSWILVLYWIAPFLGGIFLLIIILSGAYLILKKHREKKPGRQPSKDVIYCIYCGSSNPLGSGFCQNCGREIR